MIATASYDADVHIWDARRHVWACAFQARSSRSKLRTLVPEPVSTVLASSLSSLFGFLPVRALSPLRKLQCRTTTFRER